MKLCRSFEIEEPGVKCMKLKFKNQDFQTDAVNSVVDLFAGQEKTRSTFSVVEGKQTSIFNDFGIGNALYIDGKTLNDNMQTIQKRNNLPLTLLDTTAKDESGAASRRQLCIEMETGTGKTYVYTKTIFELNRKYGFTKFIIVVPSVAIREGVYKSFEITREHFGLQYDNVPCRFFIYNSAKLSDVRQFATSANIEIMIINIDAFKKAENVINQVQDKDTKGDSLADYDTYNTIMRDKEWLLSFDCPLRFIFSHSALKEGWDNPNVFQVCTLIDQKSTFTCRQKIGRGLRLCVNQDGERIEDRNINILHVMANESFAEFADTLQKEIEDETGIKFGVLQLDLFSRHGL